MAKYEQTFQEVANKYFQDETGPIEKIYVDLEYLQDFKFGALLTTITTKKELEYIYHKLKDYNSRFDEDVSKYFPALKVSEEQISEIMKNKSLLKFIKAPWTSAYYDFMIITRFIAHQNRAVSSTPIVLEFNINVSDVEYPQELANLVKIHLSESFGDVRVNFTHMKRYEDQLSFYLQQDVLFLKDMEQFVKEDTDTSIAFVSEGRFFNKKIFAKPQINPDLNITKKQYKDALTSTQIQLDVYCDFAYIQSLIPINKHNQ